MNQLEAIDILKLGHNVYLTGPAGSGKTYVLNQFISYLKKHNVSVAITASTGIASTHLNGMTLHSWAGLGIEEIGPRQLELIYKKQNVANRIKNTRVLIIDEVSMLDAHTLDAIDAITRYFKDETKPFGGLQVILSGDLFQLPPVSKTKQAKFIFDSNAWSNMNLKICYLQEQYRQNDDKLLNVLNAIRSNCFDETHEEILRSRQKRPKKNTKTTKLYTHNINVDKINNVELSKIKEDTRSYTMTSKGRKSAVESLINKCLAPEILELKKGAEVMFVANSPAKYFVNGTLGTVVDYNEDNQPVVKTKDRVIVVEPHTWKTEDNNKTIAQITQLPLRLAWAITVHKSQGMSLDSAVMDLSKSFEPGMGYVALSRVKGLDGLYIEGINRTATKVNEDVIRLDKKLRQNSDKTQKALAILDKKEIKKLHSKTLQALRPEEDKMLEDYNEDVYSKLKSWRHKLAQEKSAPSYTILHDSTLKLISALMPKSKSQLSNIKGIGPNKLDSYGDDIISIVNS